MAVESGKVKVGGVFLWGTPPTKVRVEDVSFLNIGVVKVRKPAEVGLGVTPTYMEVHIKSLTEVPRPKGLEALPSDVRGVLLEVQKVLRSGNGRILADILSAFRGPDDASMASTIKTHTTAVVRFWAFGPQAGGYETNHLPVVSASQLGAARARSPHFADHVREAATHLGIPIE